VFNDRLGPAIADDLFQWGMIACKRHRSGQRFGDTRLQDAADYLPDVNRKRPAAGSTRQQADRFFGENVAFGRILPQRPSQRRPKPAPGSVVEQHPSGIPHHERGTTTKLARMQNYGSRSVMIANKCRQLDCEQLPAVGHLPLRSP